MPLPDRLDEVAKRITDWCASPDRHKEHPPYQVYVYPPDKEWKMRSNLGELRDNLAAKAGVRVIAISLSDLLWQAIDESGFADVLVEQERLASDNPTALAEVHQGVADLLRHPMPFHDRVLRAVDAEEARSDGEPTAVFLYRAGALFPSFRTSGLLDDLRPKLALPVTLLYPGRLDGGRGLRFMGVWEAAHGYRALIVDGSEAK